MKKYTKKEKEIIKDLKRYYKYAYKCTSCKRIFGADKKGSKGLCPFCLNDHNPFKVHKEKWENVQKTI